MTDTEPCLSVSSEPDLSLPLASEPVCPVLDSQEPVEDPRSFATNGIVPLRNLVDDYIRWTLNLVDNDKDEAARLLGISRKTIYNRIQRN